MIVKEFRSEDGGYPVAEVDDYAIFNKIDRFNTRFHAASLPRLPIIGQSDKAHSVLGFPLS